MRLPPIAPEWVERPLPLRPAAALARGRAVPGLVARLRARDDRALARLSGLARLGVSAESELLPIFVVVGEELPWAPGVEYLGVDPDAPGLFLPTRLAPNVPVALLAEAARRAAGAARVGLAVDPPILLPLDGLGPIDRRALA